jgi:mannose-6-phosphate isomerase-like protein (cupin superfamily)
MRLTMGDAIARLPGPAGERFVELFRRGALSIELYAPRETDPQQPHRQDEVYVVVQGSGRLSVRAGRSALRGRRRASPVRGIHQ